VHNAPVGWALAHPAGPIAVRATTAEDVVAVSGLHPDRIVAIEVAPGLAGAGWPEGVPLDVALEDPAREAAGLYALNPIARQRPVRVTIPGRPGIARAARVAMALQLPVRLLTPQPSPDVLAELDDVLEVYLRGAQTAAPVEFLQSALAWCLHGDAPPVWIALELDPDWFPRVAGEATEACAWPPPPAEPGFVRARLASLVEAGAECATCRFREWCQGFFKWPDPAYRCDGGTIPLLARIEDSAAQLSRDLDEARALER
jgi:hypothetical protein